MFIFLPSNGKTGITRVDVKQPKLQDLREVIDYPQNSVLRKNLFVRHMMTDPTEFKYLTTDDRDYIFILLVSIISLNKIPAISICGHCKAEKKITFDLNEFEPIFLQDEITAKKELFGETYTFKKLMAIDEEKAVDYALIDEDNYETRLEDAKVALTLGKEPNDEGIHFVRSVDLAIFYAALFFQYCVVHGVCLVKQMVCPACGKPYQTLLDIEGDLLNIHSGELMERFVELKSKIDYKSFMDLTLPEYKSFVDALNKQAANYER